MWMNKSRQIIQFESRNLCDSNSKNYAFELMVIMKKRANKQDILLKFMKKNKMNIKDAKNMHGPDKIDYFVVDWTI